MKIFPTIFRTIKAVVLNYRVFQKKDSSINCHLHVKVFLFFKHFFNVNRMSETSIPVITFEPSCQNKSCSECQQGVRNQYPSYPQLSLLSLVIKIKVVQNVNRISETIIPVIPVITVEPSCQNKSCSECQ